MRLSAASVLLPSVVGAVKFKRSLKAYRPFMYLIWIGLLNEATSEILIATIKTSAVNNNIYTLLDYSFIVWLFMSLDDYRGKTMYYFLLVFGAAAWFIDNIVLHSITGFSSYFRIIYGLIVVYLSVRKLSEVLFTELRHSNKNATFVICVAFSIAYTYQAVFETFGAINLKFSNEFYIKLYYILVFVNLFTNLLYALAMLWVPAKRQFTLPY